MECHSSFYLEIWHPYLEPRLISRVPGMAQCLIESSKHERTQVTVFAFFSFYLWDRRKIYLLGKFEGCWIFGYSGGFDMCQPWGKDSSLLCRASWQNLQFNINLRMGLWSKCLSAEFLSFSPPWSMVLGFGPD